MLHSIILIIFIIPYCIECSFSFGSILNAIDAAFNFRYFFKGCCNDYHPNISGLELELNKHLYGQHIAKPIILSTIKGHVENPKPKKALVLSFHGWTGGGKNYASKFIAENLYHLGMKSSFVHLFISTVHFPHESEADIYKLHLQDWIRGNVSMYDRSLFIFDEIDKMPVKMIDAIKPFIDYHEAIDCVDYRKSMFIFLSNTGGRNITYEMLKHWEAGNSREHVKFSDLENLVQRGEFNEKGGLHESALIHHSLVDFYIPFLPLGKKHVELCIIDELQDRGHTPQPELIEKVVNSLSFFPAETELFSPTGCKRISQKVNYYLADLHFEL